MNDDGASKFIKAAKNEWLLFLFRASTTIALSIIAWNVTGTHDDVKAIGKDLIDFKLAYAERVAHIEGQVAQLTGSVEAHRVRLVGNDSDIRSLWTRLFELTVRVGQWAPPSQKAP